MIRKHLIAYGGVPEAEVPHMAKFDVLDIGFESAQLAEAIKTLNPNVKIIAYRNMLFAETTWDDWPEINIHEDWFIHSLDGRRIVVPSYPNEQCMNIANLGWREYSVNYCLNKLAQYPALDGIFADNAWDKWFKEGWNDVNGNLIPPEQVPDLPTFHDDMREFLRYVKNRLGNKLVIPNTENDTDYVDVSDGKMCESFIHLGWHMPDEFPDWWTINDYLKRINALASISGKGKYYLAFADSKFPSAPTGEDLEKAKKTMFFCLCSFLLGVSGPNATFGWTNIWARDGSKGYYPEMDIDVGNPRDAYYQVNPDVYGRDFDHAKVFVNFSADVTYTVDVEGTPYSLPPHSAVIAPWEAPPTPPLQAGFPIWVVPVALLGAGVLYLATKKK